MCHTVLMQVPPPRSSHSFLLVPEEDCPSGKWKHKNEIWKQFFFFYRYISVTVLWTSRMLSLIMSATKCSSYPNSFVLPFVQLKVTALINLFSMRCRNTATEHASHSLTSLSVQSYFWQWLNINSEVYEKKVWAVPACWVLLSWVTENKLKLLKTKQKHFMSLINRLQQYTPKLLAVLFVWRFVLGFVHQHIYLSKHERYRWSGRVAVMENIKTVSHWEASTAGVIIQHMALHRLLKICFTGVSDIPTTISLIDAVKYASYIPEL